MKAIFVYFMQMIIASGILYGYYHLMLRDKRFHQYNRFYLLAAVIISLLIPFLNIPVYFSEGSGQAYVLQTLNVINPPEFEESAAPVIVEESQPGTVSWFKWQYIAYVFYFFVALVFLFRIIMSVRKIKIISAIYPSEKIGNINFVNTNEPGTPFSFFRWLFWNRNIELDSDNGQQIFRHELFHINQRHSIDIVFKETVTAFAWFNPFFYLLKRELNQKMAM